MSLLSHDQARRFAIVCTTINPCENFFESYYRNIEKYGHLGETTLIVITDKKTPKIIEENANRYVALGFDIRVINLGMQENFLADYPELQKIIPFNSDNRRNIGYLYAYKNSAEIVISVDDDNFPMLEHDFIDGHSISSKSLRLTVNASSNRWFNILAKAKTTNNTTIYARGYPHNKRNANAVITNEIKQCRVCANAGLWTKHPDVDAITRIDNPAKIEGYSDLTPMALAIGTYSPINSQNTSIVRDATVAYYFIPQGYTVGTMKIDRFGDIWQGMFLKKCADALGLHVAFGAPACEHIRNQHNLFKDLREEFEAIVCTEALAEFLENSEISGNNYKECYIDLAHKLGNYFQTKHVQYNELFKSISECMLTWSRCF